MTTAESLAWLQQWYEDNKAALQTQTELVKAIKSSAEVENTIRTLYLRLFNKSVSGCGNCLADAFAQLRHYSRKEMQKIVECRFKLKSGVLLMGTNPELPHATAANLTDEIAIAYLKDNPARKDLFEILPNDWQTLISEPKKADITEENAEDAQASTESVETAQIAENADEQPKKKRTYRRKTTDA